MRKYRLHISPINGIMKLLWLFLKTNKWAMTLLKMKLFHSAA